MIQFLNPVQRWLGQYSFDLTSQQLSPSGMKTVDFEFKFRLKLFGFLVGEIRDGVDGVPEPAVVRGRVVSNKSIWFSKTYPHSWALDPATGSRYIFDTRKLVVHYLGKYEDLETICGTWEIRAGRRTVNGTEFQLPRISGTWQAKASG